MSIKDQLTADMKQAMKDREAGKLRLSVIRMVRANIKNVEINDKKELTDDEVQEVLSKIKSQALCKQVLKAKDSQIESKEELQEVSSDKKEN